MKTECRLCGLPVGRSGVEEQQGENTLHFCCIGCRQVYLVLSGLPGGLPADFKNTDLYRFCESSNLIGGNPEDTGEGLVPTPGKNQPDFEVTGPEDLPSRELVLKVEGMWCSACSWLIEAVLSRSRGIVQVQALFASDLVRVKYLPQEVTRDEIQDRISRLGYRPSSLEDPLGDSKERKKTLLRLGISSILAAHVMMISLALYAGFFKDLEPEGIRYLSYPLWVLTTAVLLYGGLPIFKKAWVGLRYGNPTMEVLIAIGALAAYFYSLFQMMQGSLHLYFDTAAMLIVLVLIGKYLEARAKERVSQGLSELYHLAHQKVRLLSEGKISWKAASQVHPGDRFQVLAGERLPVDGIILSGRAALDESYLTGESRPVKKGPKDEVRAGSLVLDHELEIRATRVGADSSTGRIIRMMQEGLSRKTSTELIADRLTRWIVPALLCLAGGTAWFLFLHGHPLQQSLLRAVTVLVISCPCALGIATPLAKVAAIGIGREKGILIRDPAALEKIRKLDLLIFDKTGTLTQGRYGLREMVFLEGPREEAFQKLASLEAFSDHFLARAIQDEAREFSLPLLEVRDFEALPGLGIKGLVAGCPVVIGNGRMMLSQGLCIPSDLESRAESLEAGGRTLVFFGWQDKVRGFLAFGDALKEMADRAVLGLQQEGFKTWMVSGDSPETTRSIARELGMVSFIGHALPEDKVRIIRDLQKQGHRVGMIGDGMNDAAALAQADVGFALGTGTGLQTEASDIILMSNDPFKIREALDLAGRTFTVIRQNLLLAFFSNFLGIPLAVMGLLNPLLAALAMSASSLTVVGNAMRIYK